MQAYLQGQDFEELIVSTNIEIHADTPDNMKPQRKW